MRIRNDHPGARLVPSAHLLVEPGQTVPWHASEPIPDGFSVVEPHRKPKAAAKAAATDQEH